MRRVEQHGSMMDSQQFDHILAVPVDDPVITEDDFTNSWVVLLGNNSPRIWKLLKTFCGSEHVNYEQACVMGRIVRNEIRDCFKIA
jgi:hypothetical protein